MENHVKKARELAFLAHHGQKYGNRSYTTHLIDVVSLANKYNLCEITLTVAWLHDIIEDTEITETFLRRIFGSEISSIVNKLTRKNNQNNVDYFNSIRLSSIASEVKYLDRIANLKNLKASQTKLIEKYKSEHFFMRSLEPLIRNKQIAIEYDKLAEKTLSSIKIYHWTDQAVLEFTKIACGGTYGDYKNCKSLEAKLNRFKELNYISEGND